MHYRRRLLLSHAVSLQSLLYGFLSCLRVFGTLQSTLRLLWLNMVITDGNNSRNTTLCKEGQSTSYTDLSYWSFNTPLLKPLLQMQLLQFWLKFCNILLNNLMKN